MGLENINMENLRLRDIEMDVHLTILEDMNYYLGRLKEEFSKKMNYFQMRKYGGKSLFGFCEFKNPNPNIENSRYGESLKVCSENEIKIVGKEWENQGGRTGIWNNNSSGPILLKFPLLIKNSFLIYNPGEELPIISKKPKESEIAYMIVHEEKILK